MEVIFLCGCVGNPNFGDELIMKIWIEKYSKKSSMIVCDGVNNKNLLSYINSICSKNLCVMDSDISLFSMHNYFSTKNGIYSLENKDGFFEKIKIISLFFQSIGVEKIHLFGGGYINTMMKHHLPVIVSLRIISDSIGVPVVATGQGFMPFDMSFKDYLNIISYFEFVDVRDASSFGKIKKINLENPISFSGDDALMVLDEPDNFAISQELDPSLIICLQNDLFPGNNILNRVFSEESMGIFFSSRIKEIIFIKAMSGDVGKNNIPQEVLSKLSENNIKIREINQINLIKNGIPYNKDSFLITTRYHLHMIGCFSGMRGLALYQGEYYKNKHDAVRFTGSLWPMLELSNITSLSLYEQINIALKLKSPFDENLLENWKEKKREMEKKVMNIGYKKKSFVDELSLFKNLL